MKKTLSFAFIGLLGISPLYAQTPGDIGNISFEEIANPVASSIGGDNRTLIHSTYSNAAWGDYNNDGYLDVFYSDKNNHGSASKIASNFYQNDGKGNFIKVTSPSFTGTAFSCPIWFDMNNDGLLDLFIPGLNNYDYQWKDLDTRLSDIKFHLYINQGMQSNGRFKFKEIAADESGLMPVFNGKSGGKGHNWVAAGDYDNDGFTDLIITGFDEQTRSEREDYEDAVRVVYLFKNIEGKYFELQETPLNGNMPFHGLTDGSVCFADLDNDGWLDIFSTGYGYSRASEVHIYWNQHDGTFIESEIEFDNTYNSSCDVYDLDNDGKLDLIMTGVYFDGESKQFFLYKNLGDRQFEKLEKECLVPIDGGQLSFGDVNNDGLPDMLAGGHADLNNYQHTTWLYVNKGNFDFEAIAHYNKDTYGWSFSRISHGNQHLIDYNNDGLLDAWSSGWSNSMCSSGCDTQLWKNLSNVAANEGPDMPTGLKAEREGEVLTLTWEPATDDLTPQSALRYNVYLRRLDSDKCYAVIPADINTGFIKVANTTNHVMQCSYQMKVKYNGEYEWGVQAIDNGNKGGMFAKSTFKVEDLVDPEPEPDPDSITNINTSSIELHANGKTLHYSIPGDGELTVCSIDGRVLYNSHICNNGSIDFEQEGVFVTIVKTGNISQTSKIVLL